MRGALGVLCLLCAIIGGALFVGGEIVYVFCPRIVKVVEDHTVTLTYCPDNQSYNSGDGHNGYGWTPR